MKDFQFIFYKFSIIAWFVFWGFIAYELFYPFKPFVLNQNPMPVVNNVVSPGGTIFYILDYCKYTGNNVNVTYSFQRKLTEKQIENHIADISIVLNTIYGAIIPTQCHLIEKSVYVPISLLPGTYRIIKNVHGIINPIRSLDLEYYTDWFKVQ